VGFIYRIPRNDVTAVEITPALRAETLLALTRIRAMIRTECERLTGCAGIWRTVRGTAGIVHRISDPSASWI
jgi:hypothetical protein